jgi:hypothetical protein
MQKAVGSDILSIRQSSKYIPIEPKSAALASLTEVNRELQILYGKNIHLFTAAMLKGTRSSPRILKMCSQLFL